MEQDLIKKARWPKHLFVPSVDDFEHYAYFKDPVLGYYGTDDEVHEAWRKTTKDPYHCGAKCCYVGWVAAAFKEDTASPSKMKSTTYKFLLKSLSKLTGYDEDALSGLHPKTLNYATAELFDEGFTRQLSTGDELTEEWQTKGMDGLSAEKASILYNTVAWELGYR